MQSSLFDEVGFYAPASERTAPATAPTQVRTERIHEGGRQEAGQIGPPREVEKLNTGVVEAAPVTLSEDLGWGGG